MKLNSVDFEYGLEIENNDLTNLVVENKPYLRKLLSEFMQMETRDYSGNLVLENSGDRILWKEICFLSHPLNATINDKRIVKCIEKLLVSNILEQYSAWSEIKAEIDKFLLNRESLIEYNLIRQEITPDQLVKICNYHIDLEMINSIEEVLLEYMSLMTRLVGIRLFIISDFAELFTVKEFEKFIKTIRINGFTVLMVSSKEYSYIKNRIIIDEDLCFI